LASTLEVKYMKTRGLVLDSKRFRGGAVSPPLSLPDVSRFGNDGVFTDVTWVRLPSGLWVMSFNGTSSFVDCGNDVSFDLTRSLTLIGWVKRAVMGATHRVLCKQDGGGFTPYMFQVTSANFVGFDVNDGGWLRFAGTIPIDTGWHQVGVTFDVSLGADNIKIFVDGALDNAANRAVPLPVNVADVYIGRWGATYYNGYIILPCVFGYALDATAINRHYEAERRFFGV